MHHTAKAGTDLENRGRQLLKDVESQTRRFLSGLEKEAQRYLNPLWKRLEYVPRQEVSNLSRRLGQLERRLRSDQRTHRRPAAARAARTAPAPLGALDSIRFANVFWDEV